jgi:hypothetical protein
MSGKSEADVARLLGLVELISSSAKTIINEWSKESTSEASEVRSGLLASTECYNAQRTILGAAGMLTEVVGEPNNRLLEVSSQYYEARALHIAAEHRIPDLLDGHDQKGVPVKEIAEKIGIESLKLCMYFLTGFRSRGYLLMCLQREFCVAWPRSIFSERWSLIPLRTIRLQRSWWETNHFGRTSCSCM